MSAGIVARTIGAVLPCAGDADAVVDLGRAVAMRRVARRIRIRQHD
jgi:hypothetical protein